MFGLISNCYTFYKKKSERKITLALLGLNNAGKTTILNAIKGEIDEDTTPTFGFNSSTLHEGKYKIDAFDLGGSKGIRSVWSRYLAEVHAIIYVVDAADSGRFEESRKALQDVLENQYMLDKPILVFANKQDLPTAAPAAEVVSNLGLTTCKNSHNVFACTAKPTAGKPVDLRLREGLRWLVGSVDRVYGTLNPRVLADGEAVRQEEEIKRKEREERVRKQREERARQQREEEEQRARAEVEKENVLHDGKAGSLLAPVAASAPPPQAEHVLLPPADGKDTLPAELQLHNGLALGLPHTIESPGKLPPLRRPMEQLPPTSDLRPAVQDQGTWPPSSGGGTGSTGGSPSAVVRAPSGAQAPAANGAVMGPLQSAVSRNGNADDSSGPPSSAVAVEAVGCKPRREDTLDVAAATGQLEACQWLWEMFSSSPPYDGFTAEGVLKTAAGGGQVHVCEWALQLQTERTVKAAAAAARGGHVALMERLLNWRMEMAEGGDEVGPEGEAAAADVARETAELLQAAAHGCGLADLQRLWQRWGPQQQQPPEHFGTCILAAAAGSPTPDWAAKVEWLQARGCPLSTAAAAQVAGLPAASAMERLLWLRARGCPADGRAAVAAGSAGNGHVIAYLMEQQDVAVSALVVMATAASNGHTAVLQLLRTARPGLPLRLSLLLAVPKAQLKTLAWLLEELGQGGAGALDASLFESAAGSGSVELLELLRERGCDWDGRAYAEAARFGHEEVLEWLAERGCPIPCSGQPYVWAIYEDDLPVLRCLLRLGCPWGPAGTVFTEAVAWSPARTVRWLLKAGCPVDREAALEALAERAQERDAPVAEEIRSMLG
ncbi:hypothetical protein GPECTOR_25g436 [Gonium pectorale]|uniref:Uncharacterized protein n=1 Tax=Gonium pectorale TaxID=33097 RepID=A0A150GG85_GONPE|nr:hypothetical protein GPECTOR_25g436 [Gonium pectorale]|eukprot:KXZ48851.1 hypothetical protein GPECTOR_25g436 [Gonium pectorale]